MSRSDQQTTITPTGLGWMGEGGFGDGPEPDPNAEVDKVLVERGLAFDP